MGVAADCALVVMAKAPRAGHVKTRLLNHHTSEHVVAIYRCLVEDTLDMASTLPDMHLAAMCPAGDGNEVRAWLPNLHVEEQCGTGLADALASTFGVFGRQGFRRIVALNCDTPHLPARMIADAFHLLRTHQLVVGPTLDGGYYLVGSVDGTSAAPSELFEAAPLGTGGARDALIARATALGLSVGYTEACYDVDVNDDLLRLGEELAAHPARAPRTAAWLASRRGST